MKLTLITQTHEQKNLVIENVTGVSHVNGHTYIEFADVESTNINNTLGWERYSPTTLMLKFDNGFIVTHEWISERYIAWKLNP